MTAEPAKRKPWPQHRIAAWMASWCAMAGRPDLFHTYLIDLTACAGEGASEGES